MQMRIIEGTKEELEGYKHDSPGTPNMAIYSHGPGGLLTFPGVDPIMFNAAMGAESILSRLPATPSLFTNPTFWTLTGVQDESGNETPDNCGPPPTAGLMKGCLTTSVFGRIKRQTPEIELNRLGQRNDFGDPMGIDLIGSPLAETAAFQQPMSPQAPVDLLRSEISRKMWELNVAMHRILTTAIWRDNPANDAGQEGSYQQMTGLSLLVNTGYTDIESQQACTAVDSYIRSFGSARIDQPDGADRIVAEVTNMVYQVKDRARRSGVSPVTHILAMRPQLWYELTAIWPCSYLSARCITGNSNATEFIDAAQAIKYRDEMRAGKYLLVDGEKIPVVTDDGITELNGNNSGGAFPKGCFSSDIYLLPLTVAGGRAVLYMEYFQYSNPDISAALGSNLVLGRVDGAFLTTPVQTRQCFQLETKIEPRLILRTPWLAARLQNVVYCPIDHVRDAFPADPYWVDGGKTERAGPSHHTLWS